MRTETVDMSEVQRRLQLNLFDPNEYQRAMAWTKANCTEMEDPNPPEIQQSRQQKDEVWSTIVKMTLILRDLMVGNPELEKLGWKEEAHGHYALMAGFQGQRQWTDFMPNGDFSEAILNSSFDWDGPRRPYTLATENDSLNAVTMLWGTLLTGTAQMFCDVRAYWSPEALAKTAGQVPEGAAANGFIYLTNSGAAALDGSMASDVDGHPGIKPAWEMTETDISRCLDATRWGAGKLATFRGGGFSSSFLSKGGVPLTMIRLNLLKGLGPVLQFAEGESVELPDNVEQAVIRRTDPTWPKTFFVPRLTGQDAFSNVYSVMENWGSNHCTLCYGHIGAQLMTLASMLRIPVCMHNLPDESIFRPAAWRMYGTHEAMSADFRACATYGPSEVTTMEIINAPSLANCDFLNFRDQIFQLVDGGCQWFHIDIMDGHYVPNLCFPVRLVKELKQTFPAIQMDVHLMVTDPMTYIAPLRESGADWVSFHLDSTPFARRGLAAIRAQGMKAGIVINPSQPISLLEPLIDFVDYIVLMTVEPGYAGQRFLSDSLSRLEQLVQLRGNRPIPISIDGGVDMYHAAECARRGAQIFVTGIYTVFNQPDNISAACRRFQREISAAAG